MIPVVIVGATGPSLIIPTISERRRGKHDIRKTVMLGTAHVLRKVIV